MIFHDIWLVISEDSDEMTIKFLVILWDLSPCSFSLPFFFFLLINNLQYSYWNQTGSKHIWFSFWKRYRLVTVMSCLLTKQENTLYLMTFRMKIETSLAAMLYIKNRILMAQYLLFIVLLLYSVLLHSSHGFAFLFHIKTFNISILVPSANRLPKLYQILCLSGHIQVWRKQ